MRRLDAMRGDKAPEEEIQPLRCKKRFGSRELRDGESDVFDFHFTWATLPARVKWSVAVAISSLNWRCSQLGWDATGIGDPLAPEYAGKGFLSESPFNGGNE